MFTVWAPMTLATFMLYPFVRSERKKSSVQLVGRSWKDVVLFLVLAIIGVFPGRCW